MDRLAETLTDRKSARLRVQRQYRREISHSGPRTKVYETGSRAQNRGFRAKRPQRGREIHSLLNVLIALS
jgi:hypothetical protein